MGYYTCHELTIKNANENQLLEIFEYMKANEDDYYGLALGDIPSDYYEYPCDVKWYDHEKDMIVLAAKFPYATFILHGEGEEPGDIWEEMYHGFDLPKRREVEMIWGDWL